MGLILLPLVLLKAVNLAIRIYNKIPKKYNSILIASLLFSGILLIYILYIQSIGSELSSNSYTAHGAASSLQILLLSSLPTGPVLDEKYRITQCPMASTGSRANVSSGTGAVELKLKITHIN